MNNAVFGKTMENGRKRKGIKLVTPEKKRNNLASKPKFFSELFFWKPISNRNEKNTHN